MGRLLESAEQMELKKVYHDGSLRELCLDDITNYKDSGSFLVFIAIIITIITNHYH